MKKKGRPIKLTKEIQDEIVDLIKAGNYADTAAACVGICKDTFYKWLKKGARGEGVNYQKFSEAVKKAQAEAEVIDVLRISEAAKDNWQAAAWRLERKNYQKWGRKQMLEHTGNSEKPVEINMTSVVERVKELIDEKIEEEDIFE